MNLITVIPLTRQKVAPTLSYFTASDVPIGAIVTVPLRSKTISAIVSDSRPVSDVKADVKSAPFEIRKLGAVKAIAFFPPSFIQTCRTLAMHYATNTGSIIDALIPDILLENAHKIAPPHFNNQDTQTTSGFATGLPKNLIPNEIYAVQGDDPDRMSSWRSLIRQEFARKKSVVFHTPTIEDAKNIFRLLEKGIEGYIFILHNKLAKKDIIDTWQQIAQTEHSVAIITAGIFPLLPRSDISSVVIERENGRGWISPKTPYMDLRRAFELINIHQPGRTLYIADSLLRTETLYRLERNEISQGSPFKWRSISTATDTLIDMIPKKDAGFLEAQRKYLTESNGSNSNTVSPLPATHFQYQNQSITDEQFETQNMSVGSEDTIGNVDEQVPPSPVTDSPLTSAPVPFSPSKKKGFRILSPELEQLIAHNRDESSHLFIYAVRRGLATMTVCNDCEAIVSCNTCATPVVLHASKESGRNFFMCHVCGTRRSADEMCVTCGGWKLTPLGIGLERIEQEIRALYPDIDIYKIDADSTKTDKQIATTLEKFRAKPGSILIGTEMASLHLHETVDHCAVVSLDSLFSLPDFRIPEKIMYTLIRLRSLASRSILVQTRRIEEKVFEYALKGNLSDFHRETIRERKQFEYPPYMTLIKISVEGKKDAIAQMMATIQKLIEPHEIDIFPAFTATVRGNSIIHGLLKVAPESWPDSALIAKLQSLPPQVSVKVDPESLL
jgi:primosomal protein N'